MTTAGKAVLVTGANRGIGQVLVAEALTGVPRGCTQAPENRWLTPMSASRP